MNSINLYPDGKLVDSRSGSILTNTSVRLTEIVIYIYQIEIIYK